MIYVFLDTCIFNRIVTQGQPGSTLECFEELKALVQDGKIRVIVPEVVVLEYEKFCRELGNQFSASVEQLKKGVSEALGKQQKLWNEIDNLKQFLVPQIESEAAKKKAAFPGRMKAVGDWLHSDAVVPVPYDLKIMLKAKRRLMAGRMPPSEKKSDQDASIIESLLTVLPKGEELCLCSENINDFAFEVPSKGIALHPILAEDLPKTKYFVDLCSLVEAIKSGKTPPEPTAEELEKAVQRDAVRPAFLGLLDKLRPLIKQFKQPFDPSEYNYIRYIRAPRFQELVQEFQRAWELESSEWNVSPVFLPAMKLASVLRQIVIMSESFEQTPLKLEMQHGVLKKYASQFLRLHDKVLDFVGK